MRVYAMIKYGVAGKVERNPGMYGQRRQANTEMRHHLGHPSEVTSQGVMVPRSGQWRRSGGTLKSIAGD